MRITISLACATAIMLYALPASAQKQQNEPKRPVLEAGADTNDSRAYYLRGQSLLDRNPERAADAFYWAMRLDPTSADALYARRTALLMSDPRRLVRYLNGDRRTIRSDEIQRIDSLHMRALMSNPFLYRKYEWQMMRRYVVQAVNGNSTQLLTASEIDFVWSRYLRDADAGTRGWAAYASGRFDEALDRYADAMKMSKRRAAYYRTERGRILQMRGHADSAVASLLLAVEELRKGDEKETVFLYDSKALLEYSIGRIHEARDARQSAREAYGRALQEDLAFYPAHVALANIALEEADTATMVSEMELAVQLRANDPTIHLQYGYNLATLQQYDGAMKQLELAIAAEPLFARPYRVLAQVHEARGEPDKALARYEQFLSLASANAAEYQSIAAHVAQMRQPPAAP